MDIIVILFGIFIDAIVVVGNSAITFNGMAMIIVIFITIMIMKNQSVLRCVMVRILDIEKLL